MWLNRFFTLHNHDYCSHAAVLPVPAVKLAPLMTQPGVVLCLFILMNVSVCRMCVFFSLIEIAAGPETLWALCHHLGPWMKLIGALTDDCSCADVKVVKFCTHCNEKETHKSYWLSFIYHSTKANMTLYWKRRFFSPRMRRKEDFSPVTGLKVWTCKSDAVWALMDVF